MLRFRYQATDFEQHPVSGEVVASSREEAMAELLSRYLRVERVECIEADDRRADSADEADGADPPRFSGRLSEQEVLALADGVGNLAKAGMPLGAGIRALSQEAPWGRLRRALLAISRRLEMGIDLDAAVLALKTSIPRRFSAFVEAGASTGRLPQVLEEYVIVTRQHLDLRRRLSVGMVYPLLLLMFAAGVMAFLFWNLVPGMQPIFTDFGMELPWLTNMICRVSEFLVRHTRAIVAGAVVVCAVVPLALPLFGLHWVGRRIFCAIPLWGGMFRLSALSQLCRLLAILVENGVNLPEAMRIAGLGVRDADLRRECRRAARRLEQGEPVSEAAPATGSLPSMLVVALRPERGPGPLAESLRVMGEIYQARAQTECQMMGIVVEPVVLMGIILVAGATVIGLFMPLIKLLNDLS